PKYKLAELKRGVFCQRCYTELKRDGMQRYICIRCQHKYNLDDIVLSSVKQYHILFPEQKITTNNIFNRCGNLISKQVIRRVLNKNLKVVLNGAHTYYILEK